MTEIYAQVGSWFSVIDKIQESEKHLTNYAKELGLSQFAIDKACAILEDYDGGFDKIRKSESWAAAALYIGSTLAGERRTQEKISKVANISSSSLRKGYKELADSISIDIIL